VRAPVSRFLGGHRDTIAYPPTPNTTSTIASIPSAALSIVGPFSRLLTDAVCGFASAVAGANVAVNAHEKDLQSLHLACH
jgi:hypothetical protein